MTDITEGLDLLGDWLDAKGYTEEAGLCTRAMDEINRLREALKPFADLYNPEDNVYLDMRLDAGFNPGIVVPMKDLRAALKAMGETE